MKTYIQAMSNHWLKVLICVLIMLRAQVHLQDNDVVNITILESAVQKGAVCLDGSPAGYHYSKGFGEGVNNWLVYLPGGGWCGSKYECLNRVRTNIGSTSNIINTCLGGILSSNQYFNPDFYNWNRVFLRYCDGGSFMGDVETVDPETNLHLRGSRIFSTVMDELLAKGMRNANNVILAGNSAGGLATILHCDYFRALLPNTSRVKCISDSGFFIRAKDLPGVEGREHVFADVVAFHEIASFLPKSCTSRLDSNLCFFPENLVGDIQTPLFLLNSAFDKFQIKYNLKPHPGDEEGWRSCTDDIRNCTPAQLQIIKDFRSTFLKTLQEIPESPSRGMFINSCYIHDFLYKRWNDDGSVILENKTIAKAIGDWYFDRNVVRLIDAQHDIPLNCNVL